VSEYDNTLWSPPEHGPSCELCKHYEKKTHSVGICTVNEEETEEVSADECPCFLFEEE